MRFPKTKTRIKECYALLRVIDSVKSNPAEYRSAINAGINAIQSISNTLRKDGNKIQGFEEWAKEEWSKLQANIHFKRFKELRSAYFHGDDNIVRATARINDFTQTPTESIELTSEGLSVHGEYRAESGIVVEQSIQNVPSHQFNIRMIGVNISVAPGSVIDIHNAEICDEGDVGCDDQPSPHDECLLVLKLLEDVVMRAEEKFGS
ncbi:MAG: hypothetical protein QM757_23735 [Paludibaculum sp.]